MWAEESWSRKTMDSEIAAVLEGERLNAITRNDLVLLILIAASALACLPQPQAVISLGLMFAVFIMKKISPAVHL